MERTDNIIDWTVANWITICLMVILGFACFGFLAKVASKVGIGKGGNESAA